jgi:hypothetical protein
MLRIEYIKGEIKVNTGMVSKLYDLPLHLSIAHHVSKKELWSCFLNDNSWATFPNSEMNDVIIYDANGKRIISREWNVLIEGGDLYITLYLYCLKHPNTKGLAIGTHDGEFGEWVPAVLNNMTHATLIEASKPQYDKLCQNYIVYKNVTLIHNLVTTNGKPI